MSAEKKDDEDDEIEGIYTFHHSDKHFVGNRIACENHEEQHAKST